MTQVIAHERALQDLGSDADSLKERILNLKNLSKVADATTAGATEQEKAFLKLANDAGSLRERLLNLPDLYNIAEALSARVTSLEAAKEASLLELAQTLSVRVESLESLADSIAEKDELAMLARSLTERMSVLEDRSSDSVASEGGNRKLEETNRSLLQRIESLEKDKRVLETTLAEYKQSRGEQDGDDVRLALQDALAQAQAAKTELATLKSQQMSTGSQDFLLQKNQELQEQLQIAYNSQKNAIIASEQVMEDKKHLEIENAALKVRLAAVQPDANNGSANTAYKVPSSAIRPDVNIYEKPISNKLVTKSVPTIGASATITSQPGATATMTSQPAFSTIKSQPVSLVAPSGLSDDTMGRSSRSMVAPNGSTLTGLSPISQSGTFRRIGTQPPQSPMSGRYYPGSPVSRSTSGSQVQSASLASVGRRA